MKFILSQIIFLWMDPDRENLITMKISSPTVPAASERHYDLYTACMYIHSVTKSTFSHDNLLIIGLVPEYKVTKKSHIFLYTATVISCSV